MNLSSRDKLDGSSIVAEGFADGMRFGFRDATDAHATGRKRNAMENGVRDEWIDQVVSACQRLSSHAVPGRGSSLRSLFNDFDKQVPQARTPFERAVLRGLLAELSFCFGHADHWAYHADFPDAECNDDPAARAMSFWHHPTADAKVAFRTWAGAYIELIEGLHPRFRALELRRDLDVNFAQPLSLTRLARQRRVTVRCLQRDFEEVAGVGIQDYVTERRLDAAVRLLQNTSDKVEWIANVVGWSSRKNLNRALARRRGVNPGDLRVKRRGTDEAKLA
jgi:AraC-like DNA-binding protein